MKKTITIILICGMLGAAAQVVTATFESFTLAPNSAYSSTNSVPFQTTNAEFQYKWSGYWAGGFAYTNKYDSSTVGPGNLYGVKAFKGYNNSNIFVVAQDKGVIKATPNYHQADGFYITNTTYAYKSMKLGDQFAKKFGGNTGNDPDFFKVTVKAYAAGVMKNDSVVFYLADYRFANNALDYIVDSWQWVNTSTLGYVDSLKFFMYSSDNGQFGMNTPAFFAIDNFTSSFLVGMDENILSENVSVFPVPAKDFLFVNFPANLTPVVRIFDVYGKMMKEEQNTRIDLRSLNEGIYFAEISAGGKTLIKKIVKE